MQPNKTKLALTMGVLFFAASNSSLAASLTENVKITTRDDVILQELSALSFGPNLFTAAAGVCTMDVSNPGSVLAQANLGTVVQANWGELSGTGCASGNIATPGRYKITGGAGDSVTISIVPDNTTSVTYAPEGCVVTYDNAVTIDTCTDLSTSPTGVFIAGATDDGSSVPGEGIITVGGSLTLTTGLTSSTGYTDSFTLNVTY